MVANNSNGSNLFMNVIEHDIIVLPSTCRIEFSRKVIFLKTMADEDEEDEENSFSEIKKRCCKTKLIISVT